MLADPSPHAHRASYWCSVIDARRYLAPETLATGAQMPNRASTASVVSATNFAELIPFVPLD